VTNLGILEVHAVADALLSALFRRLPVSRLRQQALARGLSAEAIRGR
jgi:hypothetical protein